jgi:hypothetical protein
MMISRLSLARPLSRLAASPALRRIDFQSNPASLFRAALLCIEVFIKVANMYFKSAKLQLSV